MPLYYRLRFAMALEYLLGSADRLSRKLQSSFS
uniref:Uncharacterized protein n=1 Tax=Fusarium oxysporum (strain Fo5176) TaxID=660025 RepID=A0A0D2XU32_FUSOF